VKPLNLLLTGLAGTCALGLVFVLAELAAGAAGRPLLAGAAPAPAVAAPTAAIPPVARLRAPEPPYWVFRMAASAEDDPQVARAMRASIQFEGITETCAAHPPAAVSGLGVDRSGTRPARARVERRVCVPGCEGIPPPALAESLQRRLELTAHQEQFDLARGEYAPDGRMATVEWQCGGRTRRLVAASVVALACNNAACDDRQAANAAVYLGYDQGRELDPAHALFPLRGTGPGLLVGRGEAARP
jgi:hypothetical protein